MSCGSCSRGKGADILTEKKYSHIIWDWNGTLFNDVEWGLKIINTMLAKRKLKILSGIPDYHKVFCFPIIQYYRNVGLSFDSESFEVLADEYISLYHSEKTGGCKLHHNAETVLTAIQKTGISQVILSASELNNLLSQIREFDIIKYFDEILGLKDIYAGGKMEIGLEYISGKKAKSVLLIGDTEHDFEVAKNMGVDCVLIAQGHQSKEKLLSCNVPVLDDISEVIGFVGMANIKLRLTCNQ
jgi:phosphoglycolate phosphatase